MNSIEFVQWLRGFVAGLTFDDHGRIRSMTLRQKHAEMIIKKLNEVKDELPSSGEGSKGE